MKVFFWSLILLIAFHNNRLSAQSSDQTSIGLMSLSLAVKDIKASYAFYKKLGFKALEGAGSLDQKWIIIVNGSSKIGLFEGLFPTNTLTFNSKDARAIYQKIQNENISTVYSMGLDKTKGPCSFSILDPDGNPILIDQH